MWIASFRLDQNEYGFSFYCVSDRGFKNFVQNLGLCFDFTKERTV